MTKRRTRLVSRSHARDPYLVYRLSKILGLCPHLEQANLQDFNINSHYLALALFLLLIS
jgi:hypothetical protein